MGQVDPKFNFDFEVIEKGIYAFVVKETGIDPAKTGNEHGKRYWAKLAVEGGDQDGRSHIEGFLEITKDDFSLSKMAGFLYKLKIIPTMGKIDTDLFKSADFEERWKKSLPGKKMGAKIGWRYDKDDVKHETPRSDMKIYFDYDEVKTILANQAIVSQAGTPLPGPAPGPGSLGQKPDPEPPKQKAPWD